MSRTSGKWQGIAALERSRFVSLSSFYLPKSPSIPSVKANNSSVKEMKRYREYKSFLYHRIIEMKGKARNLVKEVKPLSRNPSLKLIMDRIANRYYRLHIGLFL